MSEYTINDFFCGAGGVALGFLNAGFKINWACDFDKYCVKTYRHNIGEWVVEADVTKLKYSDVPKADGWAFGFPCQDLSVAGKRSGMQFRCQNCGNIWKHKSGGQTDINCPNCICSCGGGNTQIKIFDTTKYRVRKLTPTEYGRLQAFPVDSNWVQVVSDTQAYKQFGNAVTVNVVAAIARAIKQSLTCKDG